MNFEEVFAEETLLQVVFFELEGRVSPGDVVVRMFYTTAGGRIIEHDFTITDVAMGVDLPEYGGTGPVFGGTD